MHRVRFQDPAGSVRIGSWESDGIHWNGRTYDHGAVDVLPPVEPTKIVGAGANYADHAEEMGGELPDEPWLFVVGANTLAGHGDTVTLPPDAEVVHYEAELGVVIGEQCRNVAVDEVGDVIAGYTCVNDISNRDMSMDSHPSFFLHKGFDNATPIGPVVVPPEDVPDDASIELRLDGTTKQDSSISYLHFSIPELVAAVTRYVTLEPDDVIATGTPSGVGPLADGDTVEVDIEGIPVLEHDVRVAP